MVRVGFVDGFQAAFRSEWSSMAILRTRPGHGEFAEIECPGNIVLINRSAIVEQRKQRYLRGAQVDVGGFQVGLILHPLQLQPVEVDLRDVAGLESILLMSSTWS